MLRVLFIPTCRSSVQYWRIQSFVEAAWRTGVASFQNPMWVKDERDYLPWQEKLTSGEKYDPMFVRAFVPMIESGCSGADVVVFQYAHEEGALELFEAIRIKFPNLPMLVEIDDNILSVPTYNAAFSTFDPRSEVRRRSVAQMRMADGLIVTTPYLKEVFSEINPNIYVVPNSVDFKKWDKLKPKSKGGVRIGWAGGSGHEGDFLIVQNALKNVLKKHKDARLVLLNGPSLSGVPDFLKGVPGVEHHAVWEPILKYPKALAEMDFDIGIAPIVDSAFNRGKSNLKWLENSALKIPTVASNVGHMAESIDNWKTGVLCDDESQFEMALDKLISDRKLRRQIGIAANVSARNHFNLDSVVEHYVDCLETAISKKPYQPPPESPEVRQVDPSHLTAAEVQ